MGETIDLKCTRCGAKVGIPEGTMAPDCPCGSSTWMWLAETRPKPAAWERAGSMRLDPGASTRRASSQSVLGLIHETARRVLTETGLAADRHLLGVDAYMQCLREPKPAHRTSIDAAGDLLIDGRLVLANSALPPREVRGQNEHYTAVETWRDPDGAAPEDRQIGRTFELRHLARLGGNRWTVCGVRDGFYTDGMGESRCAQGALPRPEVGDDGKSYWKPVACVHSLTRVCPKCAEEAQTPAAKPAARHTCPGCRAADGARCHYTCPTLARLLIDVPFVRRSDGLRTVIKNCLGDGYARTYHGMLVSIPDLLELWVRESDAVVCASTGCPSHTSRYQVATSEWRCEKCEPVTARDQRLTREIVETKVEFSPRAFDSAPERAGPHRRVAIRGRAVTECQLHASAGDGTETWTNVLPGMTNAEAAERLVQCANADGIRGTWRHIAHGEILVPSDAVLTLMPADQRSGLTLHDDVLRVGPVGTLVAHTTGKAGACVPATGAQVREGDTILVKVGPETRLDMRPGDGRAPPTPLPKLPALPGIQSIVDAINTAMAAAFAAFNPPEPLGVVIGHDDGSVCRFDGPEALEAWKRIAPSVDHDLRTVNRAIVNMAIACAPNSVRSRGVRRGPAFEAWSRRLAKLLEDCSAREDPQAITREMLDACEAGQ